MNVVLICLDTFRGDCLRAAGRHEFVQTPHLDQLAGEGILFDNAFGEGQPTIQFRRTLLTGRRCFPWDMDYDTKGLWPNSPGWHQIPPEQTTLAEALLEAGYATGFFSDTYHMFKPTQNFTRGFNAWEFIRGQEEDPWRAGPLSAIDLSKYLPPCGTIPAQPRLYQYLLNMQYRKCDDDYLPAKVFAAAIRFLDDVRDSQPFFLYVDSFDPHEPWGPPKQYADLYDPDWKEGWEPILGVQPQHDPKWVRRYIANYYGEVTFTDLWIGKLVAKLKALNLYEDTLILVTSDHGTELLDHGSLKKMDHNARHRHNSEILWVMRLPGGKQAGKRVEALVQNQDIYPTILAACGVKHDPVDGLDVMPLVTGRRKSLRDSIILSWGAWANVRTLDWSYTCNYEAADRDEWVFDVKADFKEMRNIAKEKPVICAEAVKQLEALFGKKLPVPVPQPKYRTQAPCVIWQNKHLGR
ncbi:MAG: sulfatase [Candidatus Sumerlaeota bacterium]|nr:sulfatase [Candidatus Sumerlaeota bacterium]